MDRLVYRISEAAQLLATGEDEVRRLVRCGDLRAYRTRGGHYRVSADDLRRYVDEQCQHAEAERLDRVGPWRRS